jgi:hypothetical protein
MKLKTTIFALVSMLLLVGCMGTAARKEALLPAMRMTWQTSIAESVTLGGGDPAPMTEALKSGDVDRVLALPWGALRDQALSGIRQLQRDGDIGPNVAILMMNEVAMFDRAMKVIAGKAKLLARRTGMRSGDVVTYRYNYPRGRYDAR